MTYGARFLSGASFAASRLVAVRAIFISPNTNRRPGFEMEFFQNVLHVFLDRARTAPKNFPDLAVAFAGSDPFHDFELAFGQGTRGFRISRGWLVNFRCRAVPGGHGKSLLAEGDGFVHTHNGVCRRVTTKAKAENLKS
jgi:hypothetical protein